MQSSTTVEQAVSAAAARLGAGGTLTSTAAVGGWVVAIVSLLSLLAAGGAAARMANRLARRSAPELLVLLDQSAAFYGRWPEDRLASAPRGDVMAEVVRCRRIIELLKARSAATPSGPASRGPIDGMRAWTALLYKRIDDHVDATTGSAYA